MLQKAAKHGLEEVQHLMEFEKRLLSDGLTANEMKCPARRGVHRKREVNNQSRLQSIKALGIVEASKKLKKRRVQILFELPISSLT